MENNDRQSATPQSPEGIDKGTYGRSCYQYLRGRDLERCADLLYVCGLASGLAELAGEKEQSEEFFAASIIIKQGHANRLKGSERTALAETLLDAAGYLAYSGFDNSRERQHQAFETVMAKVNKMIETGSISWSGERIKWLPEDLDDEYQKVIEAIVRLRNSYEEEDVYRVRIWLLLAVMADGKITQLTPLGRDCARMARLLQHYDPKTLKEETERDEFWGIVRVQCALAAAECAGYPVADSLNGIEMLRDTLSTADEWERRFAGNPDVKAKVLEKLKERFKDDPTMQEILRTDLLEPKD